MVKHCLSLKTIIPNFVAFFVSLGIVISCIHKMSFSVTSAKQEFTPSIVSLSTSSIYELGDVGISSNLIGSLSLANGQCPPPGRWIMKQWPAQTPVLPNGRGRHLANAR